MQKKAIYRILSFSLAVIIVLIGPGNVMLAQQNQTYNVSGTVTAAETGLPVQSSILVYSSDKNATNKVATNEDGTFTIALAAGQVYRFVAYPWSNNFEPEFYENADNLVQATAITLDRDYTNINFSLTGKPVFNNGLHGIVQNQAGEVVGAMVYAWPANKANSVNYTAYTDKLNKGVFSFSNLQPGDYYLYATPIENNLNGGYYKANDVATQTPENATVITVTDNGVIDADFIITLGERQATKATYEIKGIITDDNKQPLMGVKLSIVNGKGKEIVTKNDMFTNPVGEFVIFFEADGPDKYMLTAKLDGYTDASFGFYLDEKTPGQAAFLVMTKIDNTIYENGIKGIVQNQAGDGLMAKVLAVRMNDDGTIDFNKSERSVPTSKQNPGEFIIKNLKPGNYVIFASSADAGLDVGYYKAGEVAVKDPATATVVAVGETGVNQDNYVVTLGERVIDPNIRYELWGYVTDDNDAPLSGVTITAVDANGNDAIANQENVTDNNGMFHVVFNSAGTFSITASREGYIGATGTMTFDYTMPQQKTMFKMYVKTAQNAGQPDSKILAGVTDNDQGNAFMVYPNPVNNELNIVTGKLAGKVDLRVYTINGQAVLTETVNDINGGTITINTEKLLTGSYLLRIYVDGKETGTKIFVK